MGILIVVILLVGIVTLLCKKSKVKKSSIIKTQIILIALGIVIMLLGEFNVFDKIAYEIYNQKTTITQEEIQNAIATVKYVKTLGIDAMSYETYYIYKDENNKYYYFRTSRDTTIAGPQEEKINKKGNINNRNNLEKIINRLENKVNSKNSEQEYITISYNGIKIEKQELLNKLFN